MLAADKLEWTALRYDPLDPDVMSDPYPHYERLREAGPLCWVRPAAMDITRYADIVKLVKGGLISSSFPNDPRCAEFLTFLQTRLASSRGYVCILMHHERAADSRSGLI